MPLIYATSDDLATWTTAPAPADAAVLLREASILIADACLADIYDTDTTGMPTDPQLRDAMRDATCAQVHAWIEAGLKPVAGPGGQEPRLTVSGIDGANVSYDTYLTADARSSMLTSLVPTALRLLRFVGLASNAVRSW